MTHFYFIRHCQSDITVKKDLSRPLSEKGLQDRALVENYLQNKFIPQVFSSPSKRAIDTLTPFAYKMGLPIHLIEDFKERAIGTWVEDFAAFSQRQWMDFSFSLEEGESLKDVQQRNLNALYSLLQKFPNQHMVVGTHGSALSALIHHFTPFGYEGFSKIESLTP